MRLGISTFFNEMAAMFAVNIDNNFSSPVSWIKRDRQLDPAKFCIYNRLVE